MCSPIPQPPESNSTRPKHEVADIFRQFLPGYMENHRLSIGQLKAVKAILSCRTAILGGHKRKCSNPGCDHEDQSYNSCGNRHCPKCQGKAKAVWLKKRVDELLPISYYHVVFTIPHLFNALFLFNRTLCYNLLFKAAAQTLKQFAQNPDHLGANIGFFGIIHTWGQNLEYHPHIHFLVSGGGSESTPKVTKFGWKLPKKISFYFR